MKTLTDEELAAQLLDRAIPDEDYKLREEAAKRLLRKK